MYFKLILVLGVEYISLFSDYQSLLPNLQNMTKYIYRLIYNVPSIRVLVSV